MIDGKNRRKSVVTATAYRYAWVTEGKPVTAVMLATEVTRARALTPATAVMPTSQQQQ
jgi:hypothetical protein